MGHVKKILASKRVQPIPTFYSDKLAVELAENFHFHLRNIRIEWDHIEFQRIASVFSKALEKWNKLEKPLFKENSWIDGHYYNLGSDKIPPVPSLFNDAVMNDEMRIEVQKWADYIHLHYKELRIEFSIKEFEEFVEVIADAAVKLKQYSENNPERFGKFQRACPHNRVIRKTNNSADQQFWLKPSDNNASKPYETTFEREDAESRDIRSTNNPRLKKMDIRDLFDITLFHSFAIHPWGCDDNGVYLPLLYRYQFVKMVLESPDSISDDKIKSSSYFNLLSRKITEKPRDGGKGWVYKNPMEQCQRFIFLIKSIKKYGYLGIEKEHSCYKRFEFPLEIIEADGAVSYLKNNTAGFPGLISVRPSSGAFAVHNGLHRLAILKYLWDTGQLSSPRILVRKMDNLPFVSSDLDASNIKYDNKGYPIGCYKSFLNTGREILAEGKNSVYRTFRRFLSRIKYRIIDKLK